LEPLPSLRERHIALEDDEYKGDVQDCYVGRKESRGWRRKKTESKPTDDPQGEKDPDLLWRQLIEEIPERQQDPEGPEADDCRDPYRIHARASVRLRLSQERAESPRQR
jgi:hypothetical protein